MVPSVNVVRSFDIPGAQCERPRAGGCRPGERTRDSRSVHVNPTSGHLYEWTRRRPTLVRCRGPVGMQTGCDVCLVICGQVSCSSCPATSSMVVTTLPGSRIIRQSSQPEASAPCCRAGCVQHSASVVSTSLRQLRDHSEGGIAGIAADSLRINGAMSNFKQVQRSYDFVNSQQSLSLFLKPSLSSIVLS